MLIAPLSTFTSTPSALTDDRAHARATMPRSYGWRTMSVPAGRSLLPPAAVHLLRSAPLASALTLVSCGSVVFGPALRSSIGWPGYIAVLAGIAVIAGAALLARHRDLEWHGVLPFSLLLFIGWCSATLLWSEYQWATLTGALYQLVVAFLAAFAALTRDLIQIMRAFGDTFRVFLVLSLALEVLSGLLIDLPIPFLRIEGNLAAGGPIQGLAGSRNLMGILALFAVLTFAVELATRSVPRGLAKFSLALGVVTLLLTRSPVSLAVAVAVAVAAGALLGIRRTPPDRRNAVQFLTLASAGVAVLVSYLFRGRIVDLVGANEELAVRYRLWNDVSFLTDLNFLEGWGWVGTWRPDLLPFLAVRTANGLRPTSALNAFVDVWLQTGLVGLALFALLLGLAIVRAWLVAGTRRNVAHVWSALVLVTLALTATAESAVLVETAWFLLVVCSVKAAQELSWRRGLR